jgi:hypothetical protein
MAYAPSGNAGVMREEWWAGICYIGLQPDCLSVKSRLPHPTSSNVASRHDPDFPHSRHVARLALEPYDGFCRRTLLKAPNLSVLSAPRFIKI